MLDTTEFNRFLDHGGAIPSRGNKRLLVTGIQKSQLLATANPARRAQLLDVFEAIAPSKVLASSFTFDVEGAGFDQAHWNDGSGRFEAMLNLLQNLDRKKKDRRGQVKDVLIAETAIKYGAALVSGDKALCKVMETFGGRVAKPADIFDGEH